MPTNFTKALETQTPDIVINEMMQDTSAQEAAKQVADAASVFGELYQKSQDAKTIGNFTGDLNTYEQQIDDLIAQSDLERLDAQQRMNVVLRNEGVSEGDKEQARIAFAQEMERISMREEQQGIVLESQKRALVRKWAAVRPDMTQEFQRSIAMNKALYELDRVGPKTTTHFQKAQEQQQLAAQMGMTVEYIQRVDREATLMKEAQNRLAIKKAAGEALADDFQLVADTYVSASMTAILGYAGEAQRAVMRGDGRGVENARGAMVQSITELKTNLQKLRIQFNQENNVLVDTTRLEKEIDDTTRMLLNSFTTGNARDVAAIADMAAEDASALFAQNFIRAHWGMDLPPKLSIRMTNMIFDGIVKLKDGTFFSELRKTGGFENLVEQARVGSPEARQSFWLFRVMLPDLINMSRNPNANVSPDQIDIIDSVARTISEGQLPTPEMAAKAGPLLAALYKGVAVNPDATDEERAFVSKAEQRNTFESFTNSWRAKDILNPNSDGAKRLRNLPQGEYNQNFSEFVEKPIAREWMDLDPQLKTAVTFNPNNNERPFSVEWPEGTAIHGGSRFSDITKFTQMLNDGYRARANTRRGGTAEGMDWARMFNDNYLQPAIETQSVTNNEGIEEVTVQAPIVITDEDMAKYAD